MVGFIRKKGLQLWLDFLQIQSKNHWNNGWISQIKRIAAVVGLLWKRIAIMVRFPSNSSQKIIGKMVGFLR